MPRRSHKGRRKPAPATPETLERAALRHLERYATSVENLRRVLERRVLKAARIHDTDPDAAARAIDDILTRLTRAGLLDDANYAEMRVRGLHRRGASIRGIRHRLRQKGVADDVIEAALGQLDTNVGDPDRAAAIAFARRRRLGPWRKVRDDTRRTRDLAALGRQGFSYEIARWICDAETPEELEDELGSDGSIGLF
jgi:regulatory protein